MLITLNDVILDPSTANWVRELSLNPGKNDTEGKEREISVQAGVAGVDGSDIQTTDTTPVDRQATLVPSTNASVLYVDVGCLIRRFIPLLKSSRCATFSSCTHK